MLRIVLLGSFIYLCLRGQRKDLSFGGNGEKFEHRNPSTAELNICPDCAKKYLYGQNVIVLSLPNRHATRDLRAA